MTAPAVELAIGAPLYPVLDAYMACRTRMSLIRGPQGSAKTSGTVSRLFLQMCEQEPDVKGVRRTRWLACRNTFPELMDTTIPDFLKLFEKYGSMTYAGNEPPTFTGSWPLADGTRVQTEVIFIALDREKDEGKLRGFQVTGYWFNEIKLITKLIIEMLLSRCGRYPGPMDGGSDRCPVHGTAPDRPAPSGPNDCLCCTWKGGMGDTNSYSRKHWLAEFEKSPPKNWTFFIQPPAVFDTGERLPNGRKVWALNPLAENLRNLPKGYYTEDLEVHDDDWIAVEYGNKLGVPRAGLPVHPLFNEDWHVAKRPLTADPRYPLVLGIDFGRTPACAICQYWSAIDRWVVLAELVEDNASAAMFGPQLKLYLEQRFRGLAVTAWCDPAGDQQSQATEDTPIRILRAAGIPVQPCSSNSAELRRAALDGPLKRMATVGGPCVLVSPDVERTIAALTGGFCFQKLQASGEARYSDRPLKNMHSHIGEALQYALLGGGEGGRALRLPDHQIAAMQRAARESERYSELGFDW